MNNEFNSNINEILGHSTSNQALKQNTFNKLDIISEIPFIKNLNNVMRNELAQILKEKSYKLNEYLIKQNDPINDIFIILKGKFILSLNHQIEFSIEHDIDTFINYQNITKEPFNVDRKYELTGKINNKNEINLIIYNIRSFFGDIELLAKKNKSLFNIKCIEADSIIGIINRKNFSNIIDKVMLEFRQNTEIKLDMIQKRLEDILIQNNNFIYSKMRLSKERIAYQLSINHNYKLILDKLNRIKKKINENSLNKISNIKIDISNLSEQKNSYQNLNSTKNKPIMNKSKSEINNCEKKVTNLFMFPTVLKNDTKIIFDNFFDTIYKPKIKKITFNEIKYDYEPVYLYKFKKIKKLKPQKKFEFLYHMKNHLNKQIKTPENLIKNKHRSKFNNLLKLYNHYITNLSQNRTSSKLSGYIYENEPIKNISFGVLNPELKNKLKNKEETRKKEMKFQRKKPVNLEIIKFNSSVLDRYNLSKRGRNNKKNEKLNSNSRLLFNSELSEEIMKNSFNFDPKKIYTNYHKDNIKENYPIKDNNNTNNLNQNKKKKIDIKITNLSNNTNIFNKNIKKFSIATPNIYNTTLYKNSKINTKNIFDMLLKNRYQVAKNHILHSYNIKSTNDFNEADVNKNLFANLNNNIDIKNEGFVKNFFSKNKFIRSNSFRINK